VIAVTAELRVKQGREADLEALLAGLASRVAESEPGCRLYLVTRSKHDPQLYLILERYDDDDALADHSHAEHYKRALPELMDCLEQPPRVAIFDELDAAPASP
jgi:quinol monooxygenase YgiN